MTAQGEFNLPGSMTSTMISGVSRPSLKF